MKNCPTTSPSSPEKTASSLTIRELSTELRKDWIERIFARLSSIYGKDFAYKWEDADAAELVRTWSDALAGFNGDAIKGALTACNSIPRCPNLPEFVALCRQSMSVRVELPEGEPADDIKPDPVRVKKLIATTLKDPSEWETTFMINGHQITAWKRWAYRLIEREIDGEQVDILAAEGWREALGFPKDVTAEDAMKTKVML